MSGETTRQSPPLHVVIVAYGSSVPLRACLESLACTDPDGSTFTTTVVDNSSSELTRQLVEGFGHRYIDPGRNLGFAAGVNRALQLVSGTQSDVMLMNPDATIRAAAVRTLHETLHLEADTACVAPAQKGEDGPAKVSRPFPSPSAAWLEAFGLSRLIRGHEFLIGSILLIKAAALADVGLFDERFFLYAEEADWQMRAVARGWEIRYIGDVQGFHAGAGTGGDRVTRFVHFHASQELLIRKHYGWTGWQSYRAASIFGALIRSALAQQPQRRAARERLRIMTSGPTTVASTLRTPDESVV